MSVQARASKKGDANKPVVQPPCVVFDTGVLLHALLLNDERARQLRRSWQSGACRPLIGTDSAQDLIKALSFPALALDESQQHELLADFLPYAEVLASASSKRAENSSAKRGAQGTAQDLPQALRGVLVAAAGRPDCLLISDRLDATRLRVCRVLRSEDFLAAL